MQEQVEAVWRAVTPDVEATCWFCGVVSVTWVSERRTVERHRRDCPMWWTYRDRLTQPVGWERRKEA